MIQCQCKTIGKVKILNLLNGRLKKNGDIKVMLIECSNMHPLNEIVLEFKWIAFDVRFLAHLILFSLS